MAAPGNIAAKSWPVAKVYPEGGDWKKPWQQLSATGQGIASGPPPSLL